MNNTGWTEIQLKRLKELNADPQSMSALFETNEERNHCYQQLEKKLLKLEKSRLNEFLNDRLQTKLYKLECCLTEVLNRQGFSKVSTPIIISKSQLAKMSIDENNPLYEQVFWIGKKQCLRPMLAPNLYRLMYELARVAKKPIRFFEIGPCFRKDSNTSRHNIEFTMLNLVEMGLPEQNRHERLMELGKLIADTAELKDYVFEKESSKIYGDTIDIVCSNDKLEIASGAMGPHPLDHAWRITDTWVGIGFGLERILMTKEGAGSIAKWSKNLAYLDGIRLNF